MVILSGVVLIRFLHSYPHWFGYLPPIALFPLTGFPVLQRRIGEFWEFLVFALDVGWNLLENRDRYEIFSIHVSLLFNKTSQNGSLPLSIANWIYGEFSKNAHKFFSEHYARDLSHGECEMWEDVINSSRWSICIFFLQSKLLITTEAFPLSAAKMMVTQSLLSYLLNDFSVPGVCFPAYFEESYIFISSTGMKFDVTETCLSFSSIGGFPNESNFSVKFITTRHEANFRNFLCHFD